MIAAIVRAVPDLPDTYKRLILIGGVPALYFLLVWAGRTLKRRHGVRLGWVYHLFALGLALYVPATLLQVDWEWRRHLGAAVAVFGAVVAIALVERYIWELYLEERHQVKVPKFFVELARLIIALVAVFLVLELGYNQTLKGLLIAPGIAAVVIGLAMQDLMGNILAGVALQIGKPFLQGDWLILDSRYAEVMEINWRSTRLRTNDHVSIEIPNRELARQTIVNLNRPQRLHAMRISILIDYTTPPTRVKDVLFHAAANAKGVAPEPKPQIFLKNFADFGAEYEIKFWMEEHGLFSEVSDAVRTNVWYSLRRNAIRVPYPIRTVQLERPPRDRQQELQGTARLMLHQQRLFRNLTDEQLDELLPRGRVLHFGRGEKIIRQGDEGDSMFVLVDGRAGVSVERQGLPKQVGTLGPGDCFGEMSLLTGEDRSATVTAQTDCAVVEIAKPVLAGRLKEDPGLLQSLSQLLAQRQMETEGALAAGQSPEPAGARQARYAAGFLEKLRKFFQL
jgi:small-conductance mechanosensitive channel/CRP-like cAMP-binding protein